MNKIIIFLKIVPVIVFVFSFICMCPAIAHPGDIDSYGCHTCYTNCASWNLLTNQYHCHEKPLQSLCVYPIGFIDCTDQELQDKLSSIRSIDASAGLLGSPMYTNHVAEVTQSCNRKHQAYLGIWNAYNQCVDEEQEYLNSVYSRYTLPPSNNKPVVNSNSPTQKEICDAILGAHSVPEIKGCSCEDGYRIENYKCVRIIVTPSSEPQTPATVSTSIKAKENSTNVKDPTQLILVTVPLKSLVVEKKQPSPINEENMMVKDEISVVTNSNYEKENKAIHNLKIFGEAIKNFFLKLKFW